MIFLPISPSKPGHPDTRVVLKKMIDYSGNKNLRIVDTLNYKKNVQYILGTFVRVFSLSNLQVFGGEFRNVINAVFVFLSESMKKIIHSGAFAP